MKKLLTLLVLFLGLGIANAQTQERGQKEMDAGALALEKKDYTLALEQFKLAAEQGNSYGMRSIGLLYKDGLGVKKDIAEAMNWYEKAAAKNNTDAMNNLGIIFLTDQQYKDVPTAIKWVKQAATQGNVNAMSLLGVIYNNDNYGVKNTAESYNWYRKAADKKHHDALYMINLLYFADIFSTPPTKEEFLHFFKDHIISENLIGLIAGDEIDVLNADECQIKLHLTSVLNGSVYELVLPTKIKEIEPGGFIMYEKEIASKKLISMIDGQWVADDKKDLDKVIKLKEIDQVRLDTEEFSAAYYEKVFRFAGSLCKK